MNKIKKKTLNDALFSISAENIKKLCQEKEEPEFFYKFRLKAFKYWQQIPTPTWGRFSNIFINFDEIRLASARKNKIEQKNQLNSKERVTGIKKNKFALDFILDSTSIKTTFQEKLSKYGIIFCSISDAIKHYPALVAKYLGSVVSPADNFFSAINSMLFSDGSFCYIPQNTECPMDLSTYFHIKNKDIGQFERTLIIAEKNSKVQYLEGCTAVMQSKSQLHAAVVEIIACESAKVEYSTVQNWYAGDNSGKGGILNFVTKRALCLGKNSRVSWTQAETGSAKTWKYPSCILLGKNSCGEFASIAITTGFQEADTGSKMVHLGEYSTSKIISKSISSGESSSTYRGLVKIAGNAKSARNYSQCDSLLLNKYSKTFAYPHIMLCNSSSIIEHEAKISKLSDEQLFYLQQRGFSADEASGIIATGFCRNILEKLPQEFALEADQLLLNKFNKNNDQIV